MGYRARSQDPHLLSYQIHKTGNNSCYALPEPPVQILITCIISYIPLDFVLCSCGHGQFYKVRNLFTKAHFIYALTWAGIRQTKMEQLNLSIMSA